VERLFHLREPVFSHFRAVYVILIFMKTRNKRELEKYWAEKAEGKVKQSSAKKAAGPRQGSKQTSTVSRKAPAGG
jgi:hypothetical protein